MRTRLLVGVCLLALLACGGSDEAPPLVPGAAPAAVVALERYVQDQAVDGVAIASRLAAALGDEAARIAAGVQLEKDTSTGAPPNAYLIAFPFDANLDGKMDGAFLGRAVFPEPPPVEPGIGFSGQVEFEADLGDRGELAAVVNFEFKALGIEVWGSLTITDVQAERVTVLTIDEDAPLTVRLSTEGVRADHNLCHADAGGGMHVQVDGLSGLYAALWSFFFDTRTVEVTERTFKSAGVGPGSEPDSLQDGMLMLPVCSPPTIDDWEGAFLLDWFCVPAESGLSRVTFEVTGIDTVRASDTAPDGSGIPIEFTLTADPDNPHILRGFFLETESEGTYREDVVFVLAPSRNTWTQDNVYEFLDGPSAGMGGVCGGLGSRIR